MPLDPQLTAVLEAAAPFMSLDWDSIDLITVRQAAEQSVMPTPNYPVAHVEKLCIPTADGMRAARLYRPVDAAFGPVTLFMHGGGWVVGTLDGYDGLCRKLALDSGSAVLSIDYRLAPEHPYPAALEDCFAALTWLAANGANLNLDVSRIAVAGDSAGANLCTALALIARDRGGPVIRHQLLLYPALDRACETSSFRKNDRYLLTPAMMRWYWRQYVGDRPDDEVSLAMPSRIAKLSELPAATIITAEYDPLRDEGEAYAAMLAQAGVPTELVRVPGQIHGFVSMLGLVDAAELWLSHAANRLRAALAAPS